MNLKIRWGIIIGVGVPTALVLIGLIVLFTKFIMNRCRKKAWNDIKTLPKPSDLSDNNTNHRRFFKATSSERQPLYQSATNNAMEISDGQISIPIDENDIPPEQRRLHETKQNEHTLVQIQCDQLNHIKQEENRLRPMIDLSNSENRIKSTIEQVQKEFEESLSTAATKMKHRQDN
ncbi:unnamed protein product [Rotaria socialis]|uniref:Uncharacterized protein n=1 Tax=Rotaria socialis TaxID=392032 RepID=A0A817ZHE2_9BILA|nr:unnamed protein product [Rotaria socialis]